MEGSGHGLIEVLSRICVQGLKEVEKDTSQDSQRLGRDSNRGLPRLQVRPISRPSLMP
jgi:hypothetical protein